MYINIILTYTCIFNTGKNEAQMASHILQFIFVGCEGFYFPVAYYPTGKYIGMPLYFHSFWPVFALKSLYMVV